MHENTRRHPIGSIDGDSETLRKVAERFRALSENVEHFGANIKRLDPPQWVGSAADKFRSVRDAQAKHSFDVSDNLSQHASIYEAQAEAIDWAKRERDQARFEWDKGYKLTESAAAGTSERQTRWKKQRTAELVFGRPPQPVFPHDEGAEMRTDALERYNNARVRLIVLSNEAMQGLSRLATSVPVRRTLPSRDDDAGDQ